LAQGRLKKGALSQSLPLGAPLSQGGPRAEMDDLEEDASGSEHEDNEDDEDAGLDDLGSLISFANLENVMKHVIRKFKAVELHEQNLDNQIIGLKKDLEMRSTIQQVDDIATEIRTKVDYSNKSLIAHKETVAALEGQIERNRVLCQTIDKKLEATVKEKTVQDADPRDAGCLAGQGGCGRAEHV